MTGEIRAGDFDRFLREFASWHEPPAIFFISSKGGNLDEAMRMGEVIRESQIPVWAGDDCFSACVFLYVAGVERYVFNNGRLGLHRPYFEKTYFSNLSSYDASKKYDDLKNDSIRYLQKMGVSQEVIDRMFATSSQNVDLVSEKEAATLFGSRIPFYEEWLSAKCGEYTPEQKRVIKSISAWKAALMTDMAKKDDRLKKSENFGGNFHSLLKEAELAIQMNKAGALEPYIALSKTHESCISKAVNDHVYSYHAIIKAALAAKERGSSHKLHNSQKAHKPNNGASGSPR